MISWIDLAANFIWIVGLALGLAGLNFGWYESHTSARSLRKVLDGKAYRLVFNLAGLLFVTGFALTSGIIWQQILGAVLAGLFLFQGIRTWLWISKVKG